MQRRDFLKLSAATLLAMASNNAMASGRARQRVVVIGGGYAGATAAKYIRLWSKRSIEVIVVEPAPHFVSCPMSNLVLGGSASLADLTFGYDALRQNHGIRWVRDTVTAIDPEVRSITMKRGQLTYDRLILAPGIDFIYDGLPALKSEEARVQIPHAWKAGEQTIRLQQQLQAMPAGGVFVITVPPMPFRCPPGPYERVCQVAFYLKRHNPRARIVVLDANPDLVSKKSLFTRAWAELYPGMIDYRPNSLVMDVNIKMRTVEAEFEATEWDVLNLIPPQRAGIPAQLAGIANVDDRWCDVDFVTYESTVASHIHVIGDAVSAGLPKSAHMATSQAHVCASAIVALMQQRTPDPEPVFANTCYSFVDDSQAMHVANVYRYDPLKKVMLPTDGGGLSANPSALEGNHAHYWARNIWSDTLT